MVSHDSRLPKTISSMSFRVPFRFRVNYVADHELRTTQSRFTRFLLFLRRLVSFTGFVWRGVEFLLRWRS
jgi:hypothetical protein